MCKCKIKEILDVIEAKELTLTEKIAIGLSIFLGGLVIGMLLSPKGDRNFVSGNGDTMLCDGMEDDEIEGDE